MKRNLFSKVFMTMTATAVMGLASCSNDNDPAGGQDVVQGKATTMKLLLDLNGTATRAVTDENATADEKKIKDLTVFIYNANGILESEKTVLFDELVPGANNVYTTAELKATTGTKTIFVAANATDEIKAAMKANTVNGLSGHPLGVKLSTITATDGFAMFSTQGHKGDLVEIGDANYNTNNNVAVTLQRLASKVAVGMSKSLNDADVKKGAAGKIEDLKYTVDNINKNYFLTYGAAPKDANMTVVEYDAQAAKGFEMVDDFTNTAYNSITPGTPYTATDGGNWGHKYTAENLTTDKMIKGVTRIVVQGVFTPNEVITVTGDNANGWTFTPNPGVKGQTYKMLNVNGYTFFAGTTTDEQLKAWLEKEAGVPAANLNDEAAKVETYNNGLNYWWVTVKKDEGDMLRNTFYKVDITSIWAPGRTDGKFDNKKDNNKIDKETNITVQVTVEEWNMVQFEADLRP
ncbi:Mfa1 family fimbria major subunit [Bacteroides ovatus]|jgi:hypothetical protein|uniref:Mfa1 family fimbria major subunit n=1 Tax=Bacteroides ovatus TaxID=28116 RepID=UPI00319DA3CA